MDWSRHVELLNDISLKLLEKAKEMLEKNDNIDSKVFECLAESRKCVETALKFRLMTKSIEMEEELQEELESVDLEPSFKGTPIKLDEDDEDFIKPLEEDDL